MNTLPDFEVFCTADGIPAAGIPVTVRIKMRQKNDYNILAGVTDSEGKLSVNASRLESDILESQMLFPMDTAPLAEFGGVISVHAMDVTEVTAALKAYEFYHAHSPYPAGYKADLDRGYRQLLNLAPKRIDVEISGMNDGSSAARIETESLAFPAMAGTHA